MMAFTRRQKQDTPRCKEEHGSRILTRAERNAFFALIILNISFQLSDTGKLASQYDRVNSSEQRDGDQVPLFVVEMLRNLVKELELAEEIMEAYLPMISSQEHSNLTIGQQNAMTEPFRLGLAGLTYYQQLDLICRLMVYFTSKTLNTGFTRSLLRQMCFNCGINRLDFITMERLFCSYIYAYLNSLSNSSKAANANDALTEEQKRNKRYKRYLKIGAASVGAGALLAVTGGLAAPAIAGALVVMGTSTLAATVSVTTMAALFGGAGAGLTGYKMMKRTRGISEFEFEQYGEEGKMAVIISVSGWLNHKEDYKRSMGIVPDDMSPQERLFRFYSIHMRERISKIPSELLAFENDFDTLFGEITDLSGKNPMDVNNLIPDFPDLKYPEVLESLSKTAAEFLEGKSKMSIFSIPISKWELAPYIYQRSDIVNPALPKSSTLRDDNRNGDGELLSESQQEELECINNVWHWSQREEAQVYELYLLRWETDLQLQLGSSILALIKSLASSAVQNVLAATVFTALASAVLWPAMLIKLTDVIDNLWTIAIERADAAGKELAYALLSGSQGDRPVTLIGYSFGARVIFSCLRELASTVIPLQELIMEDNFETAPSENVEEADNQGHSNNRGENLQFAKNPLNLIQDVILLGSPVNSKSRVWTAIRRIVGGRIINGYSSKDMILGLVYRYQRFQYSVSGVTPVESDGIENLDLSDIITKHTDYGHKMGDILKMIDLLSKPRCFIR